MVILAISLFLVACPSALAYQFSVGPMGETTKTINLIQGDKVTGNITASVASGSLLPVMGTLTVTGPSKDYVLVQSVTSSNLIPFQFEADKSGDYQISFASINAWSYTHVDLEYTVPNHTLFSLDAANNPVVVAVAVSVFLIAIGGIFLVWYNRNKSAKTKKFDNPGNSPSISQIQCGNCLTMNDIDAVFCKKCGNRFRP